MAPKHVRSQLAVMTKFVGLVPSPIYKTVQPEKELQGKDVVLTEAPVIVHCAFELNENKKTATNNSRKRFIVNLFSAGNSVGRLG